jgi:hypothetical protein
MTTSQQTHVGQSHEVGGTTTDIVPCASGDVLVQVWIGDAERSMSYTRPPPASRSATSADAPPVR